jgi:hypothetical protein
LSNPASGFEQNREPGNFLSNPAPGFELLKKKYYKTGNIDLALVAHVGWW